MSGRDDDSGLRPRPSDGPYRLPDLPWQRLTATGERYLPFSEFARLGFLLRWNVFLGADGYQTPFIYPTRDYAAEPIGFDIRGYGLQVEGPVVDPMITDAFDTYQGFARPDFSPEERRILRARRLDENRRRDTGR